MKPKPVSPEIIDYVEREIFNRIFYEESGALQSLSAQGGGQS